uniref:tRNA methyltransferase 12 homolog n=1 Tax=Strix occidentalis caurina TaxID=311401 RepID=A0A8D0EUK6_STROC
MEAKDVPILVPALATELRFAQRLRKHLEEEQLLDGRYRLQEVPGGRMALPVLEEKLSQLRLPREVPSPRATSLPQDPVPSRAGLLAELHGQLWHTSILHIQAVKSYAPHVHHLVLDLECRPTPPA